MPHALQSFALAVRKLLPEPVRRLARAARHLVAPVKPSPALPGALIAECRFCASRAELVARLPRGGRVAEVGVDRGAFSRTILDAAAPGELHLVDLDFSRLDDAVRGDARVVLHKGLSHRVLAHFPDAHFDWVYVDADHSHAGAARDAAAAAAKVKPGGYLVFNDFAHIDMLLGAYGVHRAVTEFAIARSWPFAWFAYERHALYDVALRRPE